MTPHAAAGSGTHPTGPLSPSFLPENRPLLLLLFRKNALLFRVTCSGAGGLACPHRECPCCCCYPSSATPLGPYGKAVPCPGCAHSAGMGSQGSPEAAGAPWGAAGLEPAGWQQDGWLLPSRGQSFARQGIPASLQGQLCCTTDCPLWDVQMLEC